MRISGRAFLVFLMIHPSITMIEISSHPVRAYILSHEDRVYDLVRQMTLEEKIYVLESDFFYRGCERLGIPRIETADGPSGVASWGLKGRATAFPCQLALAASWNRGLAHHIGNLYAKEWRARGINVFYGPGVNIYRSSKDSRNFEYMGEDPYLASEMAVPFIKGIQQGGVIATVKHFVANDQEFDRYKVSSEVDERTLHEIYFPPFKAAVQRADVKAVMMGYNLVNGIYCAQNRYLMKDILRDSWGFKGTIISDWGATHAAYESVEAGLDMELGTFDYLNKGKLLPLIKAGKIKESLIDSMVTHIFRPCFELGIFDRKTIKDTSIPTFNEEANKAAYQEACEGIILLKNDRNILPLASPNTIAVIGPNANPNIADDNVYDVKGVSYGGGGSSKVNPWYVVNDMEGIRRAFPNTRILYHEGISNAYKRNLFKHSSFQTQEGRRGLTGSYYMLDEQSPEKVLKPSIQRVDAAIDFNWAEGSNEVKALGKNYKIQWDGCIAPEKDDSIIFFMDAQGGYRLTVDGRIVIDERNSQSFANKYVRVASKRNERISVRLEYWNQNSNPAEIRFAWDYASSVDTSEALRIASKADYVIFCGGIDASLEFEGTDRQFELPYGQDELINSLAKVNPNIIVALHGGGSLRMTPWIGHVAAVIHLLYPGQEGGTAFGDILSGKVNPSAKLPFTIEKEWKDSPAYGNYDETRKERKVYYREGIFVGYRGYEHQGIKPLFPFGHGLSYTNFDYSNLKVQVIDKKNGCVKVTMDITNTGQRDGAEVVELYVHDAKSKVERPYKELKNFEKVYLKPGETKSIEMHLSKEAFEYYDAALHKWVLEPGNFDILVGSSSENIRLKESIRL